MERFEDLFEDCTNMGRKIKTSEYHESGRYAIVDQGQKEIAGYTDEVDGVYEDVPSLIFGDHTRIIKYIDIPFFLGADGVKLLKCKRENANYKYLYYALKNVKIPDTGYNRHFKWLKETKIMYPDAIQQQRIVDVLDRIEDIIENRRHQIEELDTLIKSRFVEMFGDLANPKCKWDKCRIVDICAEVDDIKCGPFGTQLNKDEYTNAGVAVWEIPQINAAFRTTPTHFVSKEKANKLKAYSIVSGDIAMSRKGNVGKCAVFPAGFSDGIIHSDVLRIRVDSTRIIPEFMMRQLYYSGFVQQQIELVSSGAIMAGINVTKLKQIYVHVPPKDLQVEFADFVAQTDKSKFAIQRSLEKMEILKESLMQKYFG